MTELKASITALQEELQLRLLEIEELTKQCAEYRGRWMNEQRQNEWISRNLPEGFYIGGFSQARPWNSSPPYDRPYLLFHNESAD